MFAAELKGWEGLYSDAIRLYTEGIQLARAHNVLMPVLEGLFMCGLALTGQGNYDAALAMFEDGLALAEKVGDENFAPRYLNSLGWLYMECGDFGRALECNRQAAEGGRARGDDESFANATLNLGDIFLSQGDLALAREMSTASTIWCTTLPPVRGCGGAIRCTSLPAWGNSGSPVGRQGGRRRVPTSVWTLRPGPMPRSTWCGAGASRETSRWCATSGTRLRPGSARR